MTFSLRFLWLFMQVPCSRHILSRTASSSLMALCPRGQGFCPCTSSWSAMQRRKCTVPTPHSTAPACPRAATTAASTCTLRPPGLLQKGAEAPQWHPVTSLSSSTKHRHLWLKPTYSKGEVRVQLWEAHRQDHHPQGVTKCPHNLEATLPRTHFPGHPMLKARPCPWPCPLRLSHPRTITHTCTWAPHPVKNIYREKEQHLISNN